MPGPAQWQAVLCRDEHRPAAASVELVLEQLGTLVESADWYQPYYRLREVLRDPDDAHVAELAFAAGANIVTFNLRDFAGAEMFGIEVLTPGEALRELST